MNQTTSAADAFSLPITGADTTFARGYDDYVLQFLSYGPDLRALFDVAEKAPDCALLNAHAAALHLAFEGSEGWSAAAPFLERARKAKAKASEREQLFCAAVDAWAARDFAAALCHLDALTVRWPADLCALKWGQYHAFNLGDRDALLRFGERARIVHEGQPYAHGMIAFALEQNHRLEEAEDEGLHASEIAIDDAWAHHAVAHVMDAQGRAQDGARWLDHCAHTWDRKGVFIRDHNWWHAALFRLALGLETEVLSIYDRRLWGEWPEFPQEQIGATSMLWRLELRGVDVGNRWTPVVNEVRKRADEHLFPFHDLHYVYALARASSQEEASRFIDGMTKSATALPDAQRCVWHEIAVPAAQALAAFVADDHRMAGEILTRIQPKLHLIGGSHAQRHVFQETLDACRVPASIKRR